MVSHEHKEAKQEKRRPERKLKKTGLQGHKDIYLHQVKKYRNLCEDAKFKFYNSKFSTVKKCREMFQIKDELLGKHGNTLLPTNVSNEELPGLYSTVFQNNDISNNVNNLTLEVFSVD